MDGLILQLESLGLAAANSCHGPLDLRLKAGEGAIITCDDLDILRALMRCVFGGQGPDSGTIRWWTEHSPGDGGWAACDFYRRIGYVDRHSQLLSNMSLMENLMLLFTYAQTEREAAETEAREILAAFGLAACAQSPADALPEPRRRLALYALALCGQPRLLLMERPYQFLGDDFHRVWEFLRGTRSDLCPVIFDRDAANYDKNLITVDFPRNAPKQI